MSKLTIYKRVRPKSTEGKENDSVASGSSTQFFSLSKTPVNLDEEETYDPSSLYPKAIGYKKLQQNISGVTPRYMQGITKGSDHPYQSSTLVPKRREPIGKVPWPQQFDRGTIRAHSDRNRLKQTYTHLSPSPYKPPPSASHRMKESIKALKETHLAAAKNNPTIVGGENIWEEVAQERSEKNESIAQARKRVEDMYSEVISEKNKHKKEKKRPQTADATSGRNEGSQIAIEKNDSAKSPFKKKRANELLKGTLSKINKLVETHEGQGPESESDQYWNDIVKAKGFSEDYDPLSGPSTRNYIPKKSDVKKDPVWTTKYLEKPGNVKAVFHHDRPKKLSEAERARRLARNAMKSVNWMVGHAKFFGKASGVDAFLFDNVEDPMIPIRQCLSQCKDFLDRHDFMMNLDYSEENSGNDSDDDLFKTDAKGNVYFEETKALRRHLPTHAVREMARHFNKTRDTLAQAEDLQSTKDLSRMVGMHSHKTVVVDGKDNSKVKMVNANTSVDDFLEQEAKKEAVIEEAMDITPHTIGSSSTLAVNSANAGVTEGASADEAGCSAQGSALELDQQNVNSSSAEASLDVGLLEKPQEIATANVAESVQSDATSALKAPSLRQTTSFFRGSNVSLPLTEAGESTGGGVANQGIPEDDSSDDEDTAQRLIMNIVRVEDMEDRWNPNRHDLLGKNWQTLDDVETEGFKQRGVLLNMKHFMEKLVETFQDAKLPVPTAEKACQTFDDEGERDPEYERIRELEDEIKRLKTLATYEVTVRPLGTGPASMGSQKGLSFGSQWTSNSELRDGVWNTTVGSFNDVNKALSLTFKDSTEEAAVTMTGACSSCHKASRPKLAVNVQPVLIEGVSGWKLDRKIRHIGAMYQVFKCLKLADIGNVGSLTTLQTMRVLLLLHRQRDLLRNTFRNYILTSSNDEDLDMFELSLSLDMLQKICKDAKIVDKKLVKTEDVDEVFEKLSRQREESVVDMEDESTARGPPRLNAYQFFEAVLRLGMKRVPKKGDMRERLETFQVKCLSRLKKEDKWKEADFRAAFLATDTQDVLYEMRRYLSRLFDRYSQPKGRYVEAPEPAEDSQAATNERVGEPTTVPNPPNMGKPLAGPKSEGDQSANPDVATEGDAGSEQAESDDESASEYGDYDGTASNNPTIGADEVLIFLYETHIAEAGSDSATGLSAYSQLLKTVGEQNILKLESTEASSMVAYTKTPGEIEWCTVTDGIVIDETQFIEYLCRLCFLRSSGKKKDTSTFASKLKGFLNNIQKAVPLTPVPPPPVSISEDAITES